VDQWSRISGANTTNYDLIRQTNDNGLYNVFLHEPSWLRHQRARNAVGMMPRSYQQDQCVGSRGSRLQIPGRAKVHRRSHSGGRIALRLMLDSRKRRLVGHSLFSAVFNTSLPQSAITVRRTCYFPGGTLDTSISIPPGNRGRFFTYKQCRNTVTFSARDAGGTQPESRHGVITGLR